MAEQSGGALTVSVVVPILNMAAFASACIESLLKQDFPRDRLEIVFVDNGSTDGSAGIIKRYPVRYVYEARRGAPAARNAGIHVASGDIVALTDADCVPTRRWVRSLVRGFESEEVNLVAGPLVVLDPTSSAIAAYSARLGRYDPGTSLSHPTFPYAVTSNVALRRRIFASVGLFDPAFPSFDSADLCYRLKDAGLLTYRVEPQAVVFYRTRATVGAFVRQSFSYGTGYAHFCHKHASHVNPERLQLAGVARAWAEGVKAAVRLSSPTLAGLHVMRETAFNCGVLSWAPPATDAHQHG
jgi:glycosyltransferase involved in cell wall biosynthesis